METEREINWWQWHWYPILAPGLNPPTWICMDLGHEQSWCKGLAQAYWGVREQMSPYPKEASIGQNSLWDTIHITWHNSQSELIRTGKQRTLCIVLWPWLTHSMQWTDVSATAWYLPANDITEPEINQILNLSKKTWQTVCSHTNYRMKPN